MFWVLLADTPLTYQNSTSVTTLDVPTAEIDSERKVQLVPLSVTLETFGVAAEARDSSTAMSSSRLALDPDVKVRESVEADVAAELTGPGPNAIAARIDRGSSSRTRSEIIFFSTIRPPLLRNSDVHRDA
jgi:hypothetical protein